MLARAARLAPSAGRGVAAFLDRQATLFDRVAGDRAALDGQRLGPLDPAAFVGEGTTRMEATARWRVDRAWHLARHPGALATGHVGVRNRVQEHPRIWMLGPPEQRVGHRHL